MCLMSGIERVNERACTLSVMTAISEHRAGVWKKKYLRLSFDFGQRFLVNHISDIGDLSQNLDLSVSNNSS